LGLSPTRVRTESTGEPVRASEDTLPIVLRPAAAIGVAEGARAHPPWLIRLLSMEPLTTGTLAQAAHTVVCTVMAHEPHRLHHMAAVAGRATELCPSVPPTAADTLIAAAWLHDIGYAQQLCDTGFHPLDGARYLQRAGWPPAVCDLVAHHSGSRFVAQVRGLDEYMRDFTFVEDSVSDALTVADNTAGPDGIVMTVDERLREKARRHGPGTPSALANPQRDDYIRAAAHRVANRMLDAGQRHRD
jgi:putative nucleotidyltransferase with HDIG domain